MMTPDEAITKLIELTSTLPKIDRAKALSLLQSLETFHKRTEGTVESLYNNVVVLNAFLGAGKPLN